MVAVAAAAVEDDSEAVVVKEQAFVSVFEAD